MTLQFSRPKKRFESGFTLLELLLAISLLGMIFSLLTGTFFQFKTSSAAIEAKLELREEFRILKRVISDDLHGAVYLAEFVKDRTEEVKTGIYGINDEINDASTDKLYLHVNRPARFHRGLSSNQDPRLHEVGYFCVEQENGLFALLRREEYYLDQDITQGDREIAYPLSESLTHFDLRYFDSQGQINESWDSAIQGGLPVGVRVSLGLENKGQRFEFAFEVNLRPPLGALIQWSDVP